MTMQTGINRGCQTALTCLIALASAVCWMPPLYGAVSPSRAAPTKSRRPRSAARREAEGRKRLNAELAASARSVRPPWISEIELPVPWSDDYPALRKAAASRWWSRDLQKRRQGVRILYEMRDRSSGQMKQFAEETIGMALIWVDESARAIRELSNLQAARRLDSNKLTLLAQLYLEYDQFRMAAKVFEEAANRQRSSGFIQAKVAWGLGNVSRKLGRRVQARSYYDRASRLFGKENDRQREADISEALADMCSSKPPKISKLRSGTYAARCSGYVMPIGVEIVIAGGVIADVRVVSEKESVPLDVFTAVPEAIIERQTASVDAVSGATITSLSVMGAVHRALTKAR